MFYCDLFLKARNYKRVAIFIKQVITNSKEESTYQICRPNTGMQKKFEHFSDISKKYRKVRPTIEKLLL